MRHHPHLSVFAQFPTEVVDEIAKYVAVRELKVLCLVSKQTGDVATRRLYHTILLNGLKGSVGCLQTLVMRRDIARCVRKLTIQLPCRKLLLGNFYKLAVDALGQMVNLTGLDISDMGRHFTSVLVDVPFPRLVELKIPYTSRLVDFLRAHGRNLKVVIVQTGIPDLPDFGGGGGGDIGSASVVAGTTNPPSGLSKTLTFEGRRIEMPELMAYIGPCDIIPYIVPGSQVQYLTVSWDDFGFKKLEVEKIMQSVKMSRKDILGMDNLVMGWSPYLLGSIAENVPSIERLRLRIVCPMMDKETVDECLFSIVEQVEKMKCLQTLSLIVLFQTYKYRLQDLDGEYEFIKHLGTSIPALIHCTLPSTTRWKRFKEQYWFPVIDVKSDPLQGMKVHWFFKAFTDGTYPTELFSEVCGHGYEEFEDLMPLRLLWEEEVGGGEGGGEMDEEEDEEDDDENENEG